MKEKYWDQFMASGRIDDYLNFKMHEKNISSAEDIQRTGRHGCC